MPRLTLPIAFAALALTASALAAPLRYAEDAAPGTINPLFTTSMTEARVQELLFDSLFTDNRSLVATPELVQSYQLAEDRQSMTIDLRNSVTWHDGHPLTADDVVFTIMAMKDPATASTEAARVSFITAAERTGPRSLRLTFAGPELSPEDRLSFKILPKHRFSGTAIQRGDAFRNNPVGTGPFKLSSFGADGSIVLERNAEYFAEVDLNGATLREVADKSYQAKLLVYQSLEALVRVIPRDLATLESDRGIELYPYQTNSWWYLGMNHQGVWADPEMRSALTMMVNVDELLRPIGTGDTVTGPFVRSSPFYNHDVRKVAHDPDTARTIIATKGYTFDGTHWMKDGQPLTFRLLVQDNQEVGQDVVIAIQGQLQRYGVTLEPEFIDEAAWKSRVWQSRDFDLVLSQWTFDRNEDIYEQFHSQGSRNFTGYASDRTDALLDESRTTVDPQQKRSLLQQAHASISADQPMVFLWTLNSYAAVSTRVRSAEVHPFYFFTWAQDWSVE
ncbi:MAG: peptide/nickel transport system substrate-binding protein [Myxococcota bacterium]|jgi:peptide/nickel transport system substrate-binding protein